MKLIDQLLQDAQKSFSGWDISFIEDTGRIQYELLPWSYGSEARKYLFEANSLLDMGTGGGEFLSKLLPLPHYTAATEGYLPNVPIAKERLEPLGVEVFQIDIDDELPFAAETFDLVLNKHESYSVSEVKRILRPDGLFLTQQVGGTDCTALNELLGASVNTAYQDWKLQTAAEELAGQLVVLEQQEAFPSMRFYDIGAVVFHLKAIPWQIPSFTIEAYRDCLMELHQFIEKKGFLDVKQHRFLLAAARK
ncbi:Methyltransferase domain-containing protein [Terribacillus aidingensis]|uniref:Methyltransferase domain-containing protein n=1 Tax=Terribacillus aidingensis TaxID=586416 RepID=A0A285NUJ7_9BACI|nr:class I SAM-dependent methyltransferase [Terribacillus aidingensis]SNZ11341.1 Methyltransferase domain-containing protein [Terribacillus aidingensis]